MQLRHPLLRNLVAFRTRQKCPKTMTFRCKPSRQSSKSLRISTAKGSSTGWFFGVSVNTFLGPNKPSGLGARSANGYCSDEDPRSLKEQRKRTIATPSWALLFEPYPWVYQNRVFALRVQLSSQRSHHLPRFSQVVFSSLQQSATKLCNKICPPRTRGVRMSSRAVGFLRNFPWLQIAPEFDPHQERRQSVDARTSSSEANMRILLHKAHLKQKKSCYSAQDF